MNPKQYKDMMSHLTRPDTRPPEVQKAAEEKRFNADALVHGQRNDDQSHHYYKEGYDFGLFLYNELNIQGACFLEGED